MGSVCHTAGCCFLAGGTQYHNQRFNAQTNKAMCSLLMLAAIALAMPTATRRLYGEDIVSDDVLLKISHGTAGLWVCMCGSPPLSRVTRLLPSEHKFCRFCCH